MKKIILFAMLVTILAACSPKVGKDKKGENMDKPLTALFKTTKGDIEIRLEGEKAPLTVANFVNLARRGYYDGITFHRVISDFMIQCGDPLTLDPQAVGKWGTGDPGYKFEDETNNGLKHNIPGTLSMANSGPNTNGSQFFITHKETSWLDGKHTVFGYVTEKMVENANGVKININQEVINKIEKGDKILTVEISGKVPDKVKAFQNRADQWNKVLDEQTVTKIKQLKLKDPTSL